ncbi:MAG TPA: endolytic transglycosylase MltG, partial [Bacteroidetes bacterium]|nr:endolytic transglycosylase MltG [Bacteroidota bacterium]
MWWKILESATSSPRPWQSLMNNHTARNIFLGLPRPAWWIIGATLLLAVAVIFWVSGERGHPGREGEVRVSIPPGASAWQIGRILQREGLVRSPRRFVWHLRWRNLTGRLRSGTYDLPRAASMAELANLLVSGREALALVTIPEGWTSRQIAGLLQREQVCDSAAFLLGVEDTSLAVKLGLGAGSLEGFLFPDTYALRYHQSPREVAEVMVRNFFQRVGEEWVSRARRDPLGLRGVVNLASIVQGELRLAEEAPEIAAVYRNRLKRGWKLQADPTIQYIIPDGPRRLLLRDLQIDSPYNTYRYRGLPPGAINNPGLDALRAALHP